MQWYERSEDFYKERFLRELNFIDNYNKIYATPLGKYFLKETGNLIVTCYYQIHKKSVRSFWIFYPENYPEDSIKIIHNEIKPRIEKENNVRILKLIGGMKEEGFHQTNGQICYYHHNEWNSEWGIEFILKRVQEWLVDGSLNKINDVIIPTNNQIAILPDLENYNFERNWGLFDYIYVNSDTILVKNFYYSDKKINFKLPKIEKCIKAINIPQSYLKLGKKEVFKGIFLTNNLDIFYNNIRRDIIFQKCVRECIPRGLLGIDDLIRLENINYPVPVINLNNNLDYQPNFFLYGKYGDVTIETVNNLNVEKNIFNRIKEKEKVKLLKNKRIALVGLGAIGSTLTIELARSGIFNFLLIDKDKLEVDNIGRHDLTLKDVGKYKAEALKEKILDINPQIDCKTHNGCVYEFLENLAEYDLIISSVDNEECKNVLNNYLIPKRKKIIHVNTFYNSIAGFAFISEKSQTCYKCFSEYLDIMVKNSEIPDFASMMPLNDEYNCGQATMPGGSINTHFIAMLGAKITIMSLLEEEDFNNEGYKYNFHLFANEKVEQKGTLFFENGLTLKKFVIPSISECHICNKSKSSMNSEDLENYSKIIEDLRENN